MQGPTTSLPATLSFHWTDVHNKYTDLSEKAVNVLIPFATCSLCGTGVLAVSTVKSKYESRINVEREVQVAISEIKPRSEKV
jgi:hypothetical protein